jgi:hypothetical protein
MHTFIERFIYDIKHTSSPIHTRKFSPGTGFQTRTRTHTWEFLKK